MFNSQRGNNNSSSGQCLLLSSCLERTSVSCDAVHNLNAMLALNASNLCSQLTRTPTINFVVVIDVSSSMRHHNKLSHVQATIEYMLTQLESHHNFCLIQFNEAAAMLTNGLVPLTDNNKQAILQSVRTMNAGGSTNISDALLLALSALQQQSSSKASSASLSSIFLFTDGLANVGMRGCELVKQLKAWYQPYSDPNATNDTANTNTNADNNPISVSLNLGGSVACVDSSTVSINTFGFGCDHDSTLLQSISLSSGSCTGVYYYIQNTQHIASTFSQCMSGILNTVAHSITVSFAACDGCRFVRFCTPFKVTEKQQNKQYEVALGSMYRDETRTLIFRCSLRSMKTEMTHKLADVTVTYTNTLTGEQAQLTTSLSVLRPKVAPSPSSSLPPAQRELDQQMNRFQSAQGIMDSLQKATHDNFTDACHVISNVMQMIQSSPSASTPYCQDLLSDLTYCTACVKDSYSFHIMGGKHIAVAIATMYLLERSTGAAQIIMEMTNNNSDCTGSDGVSENSWDSIGSPKNARVSRSSGYGYATAYQQLDCAKAVTESKKLLCRYLPMYDESSISAPSTSAPSSPSALVAQAVAPVTPTTTKYASGDVVVAASKSTSNNNNNNNTWYTAFDDNIDNVIAVTSKPTNRKVLSTSDDSLLIKHKRQHVSSASSSSLPLGPTATTATTTPITNVTNLESHNNDRLLLSRSVDMVRVLA